MSDEMERDNQLSIIIPKPLYIFYYKRVQASRSLAREQVPPLIRHCELKYFLVGAKAKLAEKP